MGIGPPVVSMPMDDGSADTYSGIDFDIPDRPKYVRSPADILHLVLATIVVVGAILVALVFSRAAPDGVLDASAVVEQSGVVVEIVLFLAIGIAFVLPAVVVVWVVVRTRSLRVVLLFLAAALAAVVTTWIFSWLPGGPTEGDIEQIIVPFYVYVAAIVAGLTVGTTALTHYQRKVVWTALWIGILLRVAVISGVPVDLLLALGVGWGAGSLVRFGFGVPNPNPTGEQIVDALRAVGMRPVRVKAAGVDARGSKPYFVDLDDGERLFVKTLSKDERSADLLFRMYRAVFLRNLGDEPAFSSLRRAVEHEALAAMVAAAIGVNTPAIRAGRKIGDRDYSMLLAQDALDGRSLDSVSDEELTDEVLSSVWREVAKLHGEYLAHRDLRLANVFLDTEGKVWIIDFGFSEVSADQVLLDTDVAELVMSTAIKVGAERSVAAAVEVIGREALCRAAPRMQPLALSGATRTALNERSGLYDEVISEVERTCGIDEIAFDKVSWWHFPVLQ